MEVERHRMQELTRVESLRLLGSVPFGRVVFTQRALPAVRPVNHLLDNGAIIIRTHLGAAMLSAVDTVVAYQADSIDLDTRLGWTVTVTGIAQRVQDSDDEARYAELLQPWVNRDMDYTIRIVPELVTGYALVNGAVELPE